MSRFNFDKNTDRFMVSAEIDGESRQFYFETEAAANADAEELRNSKNYRVANVTVNPIHIDDLYESLTKDDADEIIRAGVDVYEVRRGFHLIGYYLTREIADEFAKFYDAEVIVRGIEIVSPNPTAGIIPTYGIRIASTDKLNGTICTNGDGSQYETASEDDAKSRAIFMNSTKGGFYRFEVFQYGSI